MRALVVEDEKPIANLIKRALTESGWAVDVLRHGDEGLAALRERPYDVAILDVMLPGLDGLAITRRLRADSNPVPIILVTARADVSEKVEGLEAGANDYICKPFAVEELVARVRASVRHRSGDSLTVYRLADLTMDVARRRVCRGDGQRIDLTAREFALLELLLRSPGHIFTRTQICEKVWEYHFEPGTNVVDVCVQRLRRKLDDDFEPKLIQTLRGVGYSLSESSL